MVYSIAIALVMVRHDATATALHDLTPHRSVQIAPRSGLCKAHAAAPNTPLRLAHVRVRAHRVRLSLKVAEGPQQLHYLKSKQKEKKSTNQ